MDSEVSVVPFKFKYLPQLIEMLTDRDYPGTAEITMKNLPKIGYIALLHKQPIAAGFLRRVEGGYAQVDTLVSNPYFGSKIRHEGVSKILNSLVSDAKELKLHGILAVTSDCSVILRAEAIGCHVLEHKVIALKL